MDELVKGSFLGTKSLPIKATEHQNVDQVFRRSANPWNAGVVCDASICELLTP